MKKPMSAALKKIFAGKETPKEEAKEKRVAKKMAPKAPKKMYEELERKYEPGVHKDKKGGSTTKKMAMGGRTDPRRSYGMGPGMAAMMGNGSRVALPGTPDAPPPRSAMGAAMGRLGSGMAKGGGVEARAKGPAQNVSMKKKYV